MPASITAVIPVFNNRDLIADSLASVHAQSRAVDQIIVVDDASTDGSADVAMRLGATVIRLPENRGPSAARNVAIQAAKGHFIAFLDADDTWAPDHCAKLVGVLESHSDAALITSRTQLVSPLDASPNAPPTGRPFDALHHLAWDNFVTQSAAMVRRDALMDARGYNESMRYSEDYDLWLRIALRHPMIVLSDVTVTRRLHEGQVTWKNEAPLYAATWRLRLGLLSAPELLADEPRLHRVIAVLREAVDADFELTWRGLDAESFAIVEAAAHGVPGAASALRRWRWKRTLLWHGWVAAVRTSRALRRIRRRFASRSRHQS